MKRNSESGFTMVELLVSMSMAGFVSAMAVLNIKAFEDPVTNGAAQISSFLKQARAKAITTTRSYHVVAENSSRIIARYADNCTSATTDDEALTLDLPRGTQVTDITWDVCFTSRGLSDTNAVIPVTDGTGASKSVEVVLGGAVRIL